jgi:hypothetical protein
LGLPVFVAFALPGDQDAALFQERRGELRQGREAAYGSGRHDVVGIAMLASGDVLGAGRDRGGVLDTCRGRRLGDE